MTPGGDPQADDPFASSKYERGELGREFIGKPAETPAENEALLARLFEVRSDEGKRDRRMILSSLTILGAVLLALGIYSFVNEHRAATKAGEKAALGHIIATQHQSEHFSCERVNRLRATSNQNFRKLYLAAKAAFHYDATFARLVLASVSEQTSSTPRTAKQEEQLGVFLAALEREITAYGSNLRGFTWTPLTNCHRAIFDPTYQAPEPIEFRARMPNRAALTPPR